MCLPFMEICLPFMEMACPSLEEPGSSREGLCFHTRRCCVGPAWRKQRNLSIVGLRKQQRTDAGSGFPFCCRRAKIEVVERRHNLLTDEVVSLRKEKAALAKRISADEKRRGGGGQGERGGGEGGGAAGGEVEELRRALIDKDARVAYLEKEIGRGAANRH
jgi:hypothetical protein